MHMLADGVDVVVGVDTHKHTHTAAVVDAVTGGVLAETTAAADPGGYAELLAMAVAQTGSRAWAVEGTGGYGAGLARFLRKRGERVVEVDRPKRSARRNGAKSDSLDAARAAREALGRRHVGGPRAHGERQALSVLAEVRLNRSTSEPAGASPWRRCMVTWTGCAPATDPHDHEHQDPHHQAGHRLRGAPTRY